MTPSERAELEAQLDRVQKIMVQIKQKQAARPDLRQLPEFEQTVANHIVWLKERLAE